jgi:hypothetical protein
MQPGVPIDSGDQNEEETTPSIPNDEEITDFSAMDEADLRSYLKKLESYQLELDELDKQVDES